MTSSSGSVGVGVGGIPGARSGCPQTILEHCAWPCEEGLKAFRHCGQKNHPDTSEQRRQKGLQNDHTAIYSSLLRVGPHQGKSHCMYVHT